MEIVLSESDVGLFDPRSEKGRTSLAHAIADDVRVKEGITDNAALAAIATIETTFTEMKIRSEQAVTKNKRIVIEPSDFKRFVSEQTFVLGVVKTLSKKLKQTEEEAGFTPEKRAAMQAAHVTVLNADVPFATDFYRELCKQSEAKKIKNK